MKLIKKLFIQKMSPENIDIFQDLFLEDKESSCLNFSILSDNLNDIFSEFSEEPKRKNIKFVLTKEEVPSMTFLKKKIISKLDDNGNLNGGRWNKEEQFRFAEAVLKYGNDWKQIQRHVYSRNMTQVRSHAQKFLMKLKETNFMMNQKINPNLSWTKIMNYLRANFQYNELKDLFFSVEQKEEKKEGKKKIRRIINKSNKNKKKNNSEMSCAGDSNCDTNGESFHILSENDSFNEIDYEKEEKDEKEALEKFIECFNNTSEDINLNSSFEDISIQEDINRYQKDSFDYKTSLKI
jgi:SHAQKYF class myb-like DNA-binding protein